MRAVSPVERFRRAEAAALGAPRVGVQLRVVRAHSSRVSECDVTPPALQPSYNEKYITQSLSSEAHVIPGLTRAPLPIWR